MIRGSINVLMLVLFSIVLTFLMLIAGSSRDAMAQTCVVDICTKTSSDGESYVVYFDGEFIDDFFNDNSECVPEKFSGGGELLVEQEQNDETVLRGVLCDTTQNSVTQIDNGVVLECLVTSEFTCTFVSTGDPEAVPTLSEWGLISMAGLVGIVGFIVLRRRSAAA